MQTNHRQPLNTGGHASLHSHFKPSSTWSTLSVATSTLTQTLGYAETQARREFIDPFFAALHKQLTNAKDAAATDAGCYGCRRPRTPMAKVLLQRLTSS